ncbi:23S rRNA (adenine(2503)-C(2))-methyltransferase RlmN [Desulfonema magnum]|uniref:Probable dual-specificity RNA methyltransferase RlmN n=1 Tax=Desulfonema magnum TaxID=45655 RepID=A0A975GN31_9BACT|nr:23S rRNA (adenine(2503)-C(2))-methyltransferase RlmN [Desulfonema magnum]QTA87344.1 Dual-specificity RNA methyltransferase [Desulfonema magnum]
MIQISKTDIKELTHEQLMSWFQERQMASYRARQILKWIYLRQADTFDVMTDLGKSLRETLSDHFTISRLKKEQVEISKDGSEKYLFKLEDGKYIETVLIPEKDHYTLCISTQVGCAQGCAFCKTAAGGFTRNLTRGEIIAQVRDVSNNIRDNTMRLSNVVLMGMGEPLANYKNVVSAISVMTDNDFGLRISNRRITVSTAGLVPRLSDLGRDTNVSLAISLNATDNMTRDSLMPINRKYPIEQLLRACSEYPLQRGRKITFEYILIKEINDSINDAKRLIKLLRPIRAKINLIPFNEHEGSDFKRPEASAIFQFQEILHKNNYTAMIRHSKGQDISAACGQLSANATGK